MKSIKVLYIEDNPMDRELVCDALEVEHGGFEVLEAASQKEFEHSLEHDSFDVVLSDFNILGFEGLQVIDAVKLKYPEVPVIIVTGTGSEEVAVEAMKKGAADYVIKTPRHIQRLPQTIYAILEKKKNELEKKRAQKQFLKSEKKYQQLIEALHEGIWKIDQDSYTTYVNQRMADMLGYHPDEMIGKRLFSFMDEQGIKLCKENLKRREKGIKEQHEFEFLTKEGKRICTLIETAPILDENGNYSGAIAGVLDITERKQLHQQLLQAQKMEAIGHLAGGIAHDFNNLLTVINGYSDFVLHEIHKDDPLRKEVEEIRTAGDRAADLTRQLLAFSRKQILKMRILNINKVIDNAQKMLRRVIKEHIKINLDLQENVGSIKADPSQIEQVVFNLVVNARDAMPDGGVLSLSTQNIFLDEEYVKSKPAITAGNYVMLTISDTGAGMPAHIKEKIFDPFFTTKETGKGTGLGLATVYGIVKQSGGFIWVYSEVGKGTTFKIYFPRTDEVPEQLTKEKTDKKNLDGNETIILVEDEVSLRLMTEKVLKRHGYKAYSANCAEKALQIVDNFEGKVDLIVTDVVLPGLSGNDLVKQLESSYENLKVLYMSGYVDETIAHHKLFEPGRSLIQKPFSPKELVVKIREVLDNT